MKPPFPAQRGQASLESAIVTGLLFLFAFAAIEASQWWLIRQHCLYALSEGLRQGSVHHARIQAIQRGFEHGMAPRFVRANPPPTAQTGLRAHGRAFQQRYGMAFYRLTPIHPSASHFHEFGHTDAQRQRRIRSDFYREQRLGLSARQTVRFEQALSLTVQVHYLHAPWSALMRWVMASLAKAAPDPDPWIQQARLQGLVVIMQQLSLPMQSDPIAEPRQDYYFFGS
ncbi:MAG: pilus assembly protein [Pigmentiphaga sp.]|nr:pilus assembly protein [Pigmentiphaga sp.]